MERLRGLTVLVVEDDDDARAMLVECMTLYGARVLAAANASEGYSMLATREVDAVVTDVAMPGEDGLSMVRRARHDLGVQDVPCVVLSGHGSAKDVRDIDGDPLVFLQKPVDLTAMITILRAMTIERVPRPRCR